MAKSDKNKIDLRSTLVSGAIKNRMTLQVAKQKQINEKREKRSAG